MEDLEIKQMDPKQTDINLEEIPEIVVDKSRKLKTRWEKCDASDARTLKRMDDKKDYIVDLGHKKSRHSAPKYTPCICCGVFVVVVIVTSVLVNIYLYKDFRECRDNLCDDAVIGTVVYTDASRITYNINSINCSILNQGQVSEIGKKYTIYKSNNGACSMTQETHTCDGGLIVFNIVYCMVVLVCSAIAQM